MPEAVAEQVISKLSETEFAKGDNYFVKKAITLSIPREGAPQQQDEGHSDSHESHDTHDRHESHEGHEGSESSHDDDGDGPNILAVD